ncbi:MAG TPA: hypothetical protein VF557_11335 [Jatrophihabitans sp.]|uniref:hypothetical protein n=1 Tax=Jatrophihabitans sp. TaxID=1932789 RepID=UPI002EE3FE08
MTQPPPLDLGSGKGNRTAAGRRPGRSRRYRENFGLLAAAVVVFAVIAGTVLGIQASLSDQDQQDQNGRTDMAMSNVGRSGPGGRAGMPSCTALAPDRWLQAIRAGVVQVNPSLNQVVSVNGDTGDYLALQGNEPTGQTSAIYSDLEVALFRGSRGVPIYTPEGSDIPHADPTGAITADWVTFAVARPQNLDYSYKVLLYDRGADVIRTLAELPQQHNAQGKSVLGAPVIAAGKVYWLATVPTEPETTTLESWDLARNSASASVHAAGATGLVSYGIGVALIHHRELDAALIHGAGAPLSSLPTISSMLVGNNFGFDGRGKLSYVREESGRTIFYTLSVDSGSLELTGYPAKGPFAEAAISPLLATEVNTQYSLLDLRSGARIRLPEDVRLQAVVGNEVIFGTGSTKSGAAGLSRVTLSDLPPVDC